MSGTFVQFNFLSFVTPENAAIPLQIWTEICIVLSVYLSNGLLSKICHVSVCVWLLPPGRITETEHIASSAYTVCPLQLRAQFFSAACTGRANKNNRGPGVDVCTDLLRNDGDTLFCLAPAARPLFVHGSVRVQRPHSSCGFS